MLDENALKSLNFVKKQFLCNVPLRNFVWGDLALANEEIQRLVIANTVGLDLVQKYPVKISYQKCFLNLLIANLELQGSVIEDCCYEEYGRLVALPTEKFCFKHYLLENGGKVISLKENVNLISDGTTGLRTWQASLALSEWIVSNPCVFEDKTVLELGSGVGLTGLTLCLTCTPARVYLTDCHSSVLAALCENVKLNIGNVAVPNFVNNCLLKVAFDTRKSVQVLNVPWEEVTPEVCVTLGTIDRIVAADVIYDSELFKPLISAVDCLFQCCGVEQFVLSCTVRNSATLEAFLELIGGSYNVGDVELPVQRNFLWPTDAPVKIFSFTKK